MEVAVAFRWVGIRTREGGRQLQGHGGRHGGEYGAGQGRGQRQGERRRSSIEKVRKFGFLRYEHAPTGGAGEGANIDRTGVRPIEEQSDWKVIEELEVLQRTRQLDTFFSD